MRQVRRNRLAEEEPFECRKGGFFSDAGAGSWSSGSMLLYVVFVARFSISDPPTISRERPRPGRRLPVFCRGGGVARRTARLGPQSARRPRRRGGRRRGGRGWSV